MSEFHLANIPPAFEETTHYKLVRTLLLAWWIAFVFRAFDVRTMMSNLSQAGSATEEGSAANQLLVFLLAALGAYHLPRAWHVLQSRQGRNVVLLLVAYLGWSGSSLLWSEDPSLTIRRFGSLCLLVIGCAGVGAGFYSRTAGGVITLAKHVFAAGIVAVVILVPPQLRQVNANDLLDPKFTLKDTMNIAALAFPVGYASLAAIVLFERRAVIRTLALTSAAIVMLLLKGRSMMGDAAAAGMLLASRLDVRAGVRRFLVVLGVAMTALLADLGTGGRLFITWILGAYDQLDGILPWLSNGAGMKNLTSLSGRGPLWDVLYTYVPERPLAGSGFGAFWTPEHLQQVYYAAGWRAVVAHNGFLDELLATGLVGLSLFLALWIYVMIIAVRASRLDGAPGGYLVAAWLGLFLLFNTMDSVMQWYFQTPTIVSLCAIFAMMPAFSDHAGEWTTVGIPVGHPFVLRKVGV